jgi:hypothetical protein
VFQGLILAADPEKGSYSLNNLRDIPFHFRVIHRVQHFRDDQLVFLQQVKLDERLL